MPTTKRAEYPQPDLITSTEALTALCERLRHETFVTVDTEFMRERTYWPELCVVQLASDTEVAVVDTLAPGSNGFIRVVMRGLARERRLGDIGAQPPFRLTRYAGGEITLTDTSSGKQIDLGAFGSTNTEAFARLINLRETK